MYGYYVDVEFAGERKLVTPIRNPLLIVTSQPLFIWGRVLTEKPTGRCQYES
jgi:hypothetical protein